jgi:hypothetical protein
VDKKNSNSWNNSPVTIEKMAPVAASTSWGVTSPAKSAATIVSTDSDLSLGSWGNPTATVGGWNSKTSSKSSNANTWAAVPTAVSVKKQFNGWNGAQLPWENETTSTTTVSKSTSPVQQPITKKASEVSVPSDMTPTSAPSAIAPTATTSTARSGPPGMTAASSNKAPPGLATAATTATTKFEEPLTPINIPTPSVSTPLGLNNMAAAPPSLLSATLASTISQLQDPLPANLNELDAASLLVIVMNLHRENGALIQSVYTMQQEMSMMSTRYAEVMTLARERESQTLALFESRKQTEMEEARRYVLNLEARVKQMEEQLKGNNGTTAGFGNQDLFAGYREEMSTGGSSHQNNNTSSSSTRNHHHHNNHHHGRKLWQKNAVVRCGNCGEVGHASAECKVNVY